MPVLDFRPVWVTAEVVERAGGAARLTADGLGPADGWVNIGYAHRPEDRDALRAAPPGVPVTVQLPRAAAQAARLPFVDVGESAP
jgi:hypothetical protein